MRKRNGKQTAVRICIALGLVLVLIVAGTILHMKTHGGGFFAAMGDFLGSTWNIIARKQN